MILAEPLTSADVDVEGNISGVIAVGLGELIKWDLEEFLDTISERLCGSALLTDVEYSIVGFNDDEQELHLKVAGNTKMVFGGDEDADGFTDTDLEDDDAVDRAYYERHDSNKYGDPSDE